MTEELLSLHPTSNMAISTCIYLLTTLITPILANVYLEKLSTLYLPYRYDNNAAKYKYEEGAVEQFAYDSENQIVYTIGETIIHVIDVGNVSNPVILHHKSIQNTAFKDVEYCGGFVIVARVDNINTESGILEIYRKYNKTSNNMALVQTIRVGKDPDVILPTSDCRTLLVTLEAQAYPNMMATTIIDPPGGVAVIKFASNDLSQAPTTNSTANFTYFDNRWEDLVRRGARFVYRMNNNKFSNDLEPEGITLNADETKAYVALQNNNAIAELDIGRETITAIYPLGFKDWRNLKLDVSDRDNAMIIRAWPVFGMYQPDAIQYFTFGGKAYIVTANEGASKDYSDDVIHGFNEEVRVKDMTFGDNSILKKWANQNGFPGSTIKELKNMGRLKVTNINGKINGSTMFDAPYTFGARSFSIWRVSDMVRVYDSGSDLEDKISKLAPHIFNADSGEEDNKVAATKDMRSSAKGPEPEMVTVGEYGGKTLLFIGCEQPGLIFVYSITNDVTKPKFEDMWCGIPNADNTWEELYNQRNISGIDPEEIRFVKKGPNNKPLLMSIGAISGTFSIFEVKDRDTGAAHNLTPDKLLTILVVAMAASLKRYLQ